MNTYKTPKDYLKAIHQSEEQAVSPISFAESVFRRGAATIKNKIKTGEIPHVLISGKQFIPTDFLCAELVKREELILSLKDFLETRVKNADKPKLSKIYYGELMEHFDFNVSIPAERTDFGWLLGEASRASFSEYDVLISALVVRTDSDLPGAGFIELADDLGIEYKNERKLVKSHIKMAFDRFSARA